MRILITGAAGFVGPHLAREAARRGHDVVGTDREGCDPMRFPCDDFVFADLCRADDLARLFRDAAPECVVHLAAQSNPAASWSLPEETFRANVAAVCSLVEAAGRCPETRRVVFVSSSDTYGPPLPGELPVKESNPQRPATPYAVSKIAAEHCLRICGERAGIETVVLRPFSHTGPGQTDKFVVPSFARQIARVEAGLQPELLHGGLDACRDFSDVRDVVRAYCLAAESAPSGSVYNVCSGAGVRIHAILEALVGMAARPIPLRQDAGRVRPESVMDFHGDASAIRDAIGWRAEIPLAVTLRDVLDDQRAAVARESERTR